MKLAERGESNPTTGFNYVISILLLETLRTSKKSFVVVFGQIPFTHLKQIPPLLYFPSGHYAKQIEVMLSNTKPAGHTLHITDPLKIDK